MLENFSLYSEWGMWFLQFAVGVIFIYHGWPKLKRMGKFFSVGGGLHGLVEFVGGLALIAGWYVREVGLIFAVIMLGAIWFKKVKWHVPFAPHDKAGWEFDLILLAASLYFLVH